MSKSFILHNNNSIFCLQIGKFFSFQMNLFNFFSYKNLFSAFWKMNEILRNSDMFFVIRFYIISFENGTFPNARKFWKK